VAISKSAGSNGNAPDVDGSSPFLRAGVADAVAWCCPVVELRRYSIQSGSRDTFIELFERELMESQEAAGIRLIGQFRDLDAPDIFVWLRGFPDMSSRAAALAAFYEGPVWQAHRSAANRMLIDNDDVRLLRPALPYSGFGRASKPRGRDEPTNRGVIVATIYSISPNLVLSFAEFFARDIAPILRSIEAPVLATLVTETSPNTYPRLPVRQGEHFFVSFLWFKDGDTHDRFDSRLAMALDEVSGLRSTIDRLVMRPPENWRLSPTSRSYVP
jgi:hypothetical protein